MKDYYSGCLILLLFNCFNTGLSCEPRDGYGWFGPNRQYKCHCVKSCGADGECKDGCESGWFGAKCQYQDLITFAQGKITSENDDVSVLKDNNDETCTDKRIITVDFKTNYYFSWLRAVVEYTYPTRPSISLQSYSNIVIECTVNKTIIVDNKYMDIQCFASSPVRYLIIQTEGVKLCTLWVSGGKNVALMQKANQSSTFTQGAPSQACNAVDGNTDGEYNNFSCSHTDNFDLNPKWELSFKNPSLVNRIVIYNRIGKGSGRLKHFYANVQYTNAKAWTYHPLSDNRNIMIFTNPNQKTKFLRVSFNQSTQTQDRSEKYLTLCEVEAYSECPQGFWGLECDKTCDQNCDEVCRQDDGHCTNNCIGFSDPPRCSKVCPPGLYGLDCQDNCSENCFHPCNSTDGHCSPCRSGYEGESCQKEVTLRRKDETSNSFNFVNFGVGVASLAVAVAIVFGIILLRRSLLRRRCKRVCNIYNQPDVINSDINQYENAQTQSELEEDLYQN